MHNAAGNSLNFLSRNAANQKNTFWSDFRRTSLIFMLKKR